MFKRISIKNFRTHKDSFIELSDLTLIIGANNSGKSNFFAGLHFFSRLISRFNPSRLSSERKLTEYDYYQQRHSLSEEDEPIAFNCEWIKDKITINYSLRLYSAFLDIYIVCDEEILVYDNGRKVYSLDEKESRSLTLQGKVGQEKEINIFKSTVANFFKEVTSFYYYNFQPSFVKGEGVPMAYKDGDYKPMASRLNSLENSKSNYKINIPFELGKEGAFLQDILLYIKDQEEETYNRFFGYLKRFIKNFNGLVVKDNKVKWQFDMGGSNFPYYDADKVSDGLMKAAAVALLCSLRRPPALIMIEEVENGLNQRKIAEFLSWLTQASDGSTKMQFILSSHSPSVIREFSSKLDCVYNVHLREKDFVSKVTNLNSAILPLVDMGTILDDEIVEIDGKKIVKIKPYQLVELFYNGVLGEL